MTNFEVFRGFWGFFEVFRGLEGGRPWNDHPTHLVSGYRSTDLVQFSGKMGPF